MLGNSLFMMRALLDQAYRSPVEDLGALSLPIDIVSGAYDGLTPVAFAEELAKLLPDGRRHLAARSGHQIMLEQPDLINALLDTMVAG